MSLFSGLRSGLRSALRSGLNPGSAALADLDATSGIYVPSSAAQYAALGLTAPDSLWLCQEASGDLADSIGSLTLPDATTPLYEQAATGWTRLGVGFTDGTADRFTAAAASGPDPTTTSSLWLYYMVLNTEPTAARIIGGATRCSSSTDNVRVLLNPSAGTNRLSINCDAVTANGTIDHPAGSYVFALRFDHANEEVVAYSNLDIIAGTFSAAVVDGDKGIGGNVSPDAVCVYAAMWSGASAEITNAAVKAMLQTLGWTVDWSP